MIDPRTLLVPPATATLAALAQAAPQSFVLSPSDIPLGSLNAGSSENIDFADVDLDGDWDAAIADGGDGGDERCRIWINMGHLQGSAVGRFGDQTMQRLPVAPDTSRDIEFADFDGDADPDIYVTNTSSISNQTSRFWINAPGGGPLGYYVDETSTRWVGLGGSGSSVDPSLVLPGGGFVDWSGDSDFADLDNDGDLDLVQSSYGSGFAAETPTRMFLNDGLGYFSEWNPSGFQLSGADIHDGDGGLWAEGTQLHNTSSNDGTTCDIAASTLDIELGDVDGDFDLDFLLGSKIELPRLFANRLEGSNLAPAHGTPLFRDVSTAVFPPAWAGGRNYEQEFADFDHDGDLDIFGLNWSGLNDAWYENLDDGTFDHRTTMDDLNDDNEGDAIDYDNDGDLDVIVASFSGQDRLYENVGPGNPTSFHLVDVTAGELPVGGLQAFDVEVCDVDADGDYDVFVANATLAPNHYLRNVTGVVDSHAPYIPALEQAPARAPGPEPTVIRAPRLRQRPLLHHGGERHPAGGAHRRRSVDGLPDAVLGRAGVPRRAPRRARRRRHVPRRLGGRLREHGHFDRTRLPLHGLRRCGLLQLRAQLHGDRGDDQRHRYVQRGGERARPARGARPRPVRTVLLRTAAGQRRRWRAVRQRCALCRSRHDLPPPRRARGRRPADPLGRPDGPSGSWRAGHAGVDVALPGLVPRPARGRGRLRPLERTQRDLRVTRGRVDGPLPRPRGLP